MSTDDYRRALDAAVKEYETLGLQRAELDDRLAQLHQTIGTLLRLCGLEPTVPWGLTDACRTVLRNADVPLSPTDIRDRLVAIGCDLDRYSNELAAIHTVLRRLYEGGEIHTIAAPGKGLWRWTGRPRTIALSAEAAERLRQSGIFHTSKPVKRTKKGKE